MKPMAPELNNHTHEQSPLIDESELPGVPAEDLNSARRLLYISHAFNQFSENAWQFCLILFLAAFTNYESLFLVSSYGLTSALGVCGLGAAAGKFIDGADRLVVARSFIGLENCAVLLATLCCYTLLGLANDETTISSADSRLVGIPTSALSITLLVLIHLLGTAAKVLDKGFLVAVERDWIVVMSECIEFSSHSNIIVEEDAGTQSAWLSTTNVAMRQIDLSCKVVAPAAAGFFVAYFDDGSSRTHGADLKGAAVLVGIVNSMALIVEYICTAKIYKLVPSLAKKDLPNAETLCDIEDGANSSKTPCGFLQLPNSFQSYFKQKTCWAGLSLSLLYLNVLSFGGIMTAYLVWRGMQLDTIGVLRGISSAIGLVGTFVYYTMSRRLGLTSTGMYSITFQFLCLSLSYASLFNGDYTVSLVMLITGVCSSRVWLWAFDIAVTQLMQLHVDEDVRGLVGGVQQSLNALFEMLAFALGLFLPDPEYFHIYVAVGYICVGLAVIFYWFGVYRSDIISSTT